MAGASRYSFAEQLFPGCVVIVKEGDLGFLLKSRRAEHLFKEALGAGGEEVRGGESDRTDPRRQHQRPKLDEVGQKRGRK